MTVFNYPAIHKVLKDLGHSPAYKGFDYIAEAIMLHESKNPKTMYVYSAIAKHHNVTQASVERAIRHAIVTSTPHSDLTLGKTIFGKRYDENCHLTCTEYIRCIAYYLREV